MKTRSILVSAAAFLAGVALALAADNSMMGTWKLNEAKSKAAPGTGKNMSVTYTAAGDSIKAVIDGVDKDGKPTHNEWTGKFDGKDYPVTGDMSSDMRSYKMIDASTMEVVAKKGGKVVLTGKIVTAADGKSRTVTATWAETKAMSVGVYDKQ